MHARFVFTAMCTTLLFANSAWSQSDELDPSQHRDRILELADRYWEHRQSLNPLRCEYTVALRARVSSLDQLITGDIEPGNTFDGRLLFHNDLVLWTFESRQPEQVESVDETTNTFVVSGVSSYFLASGEARLLLDSGARVVNSEEKANNVGTGTHPLSLGWMGPSETRNPRVVIYESLEQAEYLGEADHFGVTVEGVSLTARDGELQIWFAPEWGYLPARMELRHGEGFVSVDVITEVEQLSEGRWFPKTVLDYRGDLDQLDEFESGMLTEGDKFRAERMVTTLVDVDTPPDEHEFSLVIPQSTFCWHGDNNLYIQEQRAIHASKLDEFIQEIDNEDR